MALDILGILGVVDIKGHKIDIQDYNVRSCGEIIISGSLVEEQDLKLASASNPSTQQPQLTYRGDPTPPKLSSQVIEGTSASLLSSQVPQGPGPSASFLKEKKKTRRARNDAKLGSQPQVKLVRVDKRVTVAGKRSRSRVVDTPPKTLGKDSSVATPQNDERGMRLRTRQIKRRTKNKKVNVKVPTKKRLVPRSVAYKRSFHILRNKVNYYKRRHTDPVHRRNKCRQKKYHSCSDCGKTFTAPSAFAYHVISHSSERPFPCTICGQRFKRAKTRKFHEDSHKGLRPFVCKQSDCGKAFRVKCSLIRHELGHSGTITKDHVCDICGKAYYRKDQLKGHVERVHDKNQTGYKHKCSDCDKTFRYPSDLAIHSVTHSTERPFPCSICGMSFKYKKNLVRHEAVHIATKDHVCDICGKAFKRRQDLRKHEKKMGHE